MLLRALYLLLSLILVPFPTYLFSQPQQVIIIGYAEVDNTYNLSPTGIQRASLLPNYFSSLTSQGFTLPNVIFAAKASVQVSGPAALQTATPTSKSIKQPINTYSADDAAGLVSKLLTNPTYNNKSVLIVWDLAKINSLIAAFGYVPPPGPSQTCSALTYVLSTLPAVGSPSPTVLNQNLLPGDVSCGGVTPPTPPTPDLVYGYLPITIYNGTTSAVVNGVEQPITDSQIYILVQTNAGANVLQFTADASGRMLGSQITTVPTPGNAASYYSSFYSYALSSFPSTVDNFYTLYIPSNLIQIGSRIYFSLINPINWLVNPNTNTITSMDDSFSTTDNTYYTLYDKVEYTVTLVTNAITPFWQLVMNSTMVDYYCLPLSFYINYQANSLPTTSYTGLSPSFSRQDVFSTYQNTLATLPGSGANTWSTLYTSYIPIGGSSVNLRIASANSGALKPTENTPLFPNNYLTANPNSTCQWFTSLWTNNSPPPAAYYNASGANNTITLDLSNAGANSGTATGQVDGSGNFVFNINSGRWAGGVVTFQPPQTIAPFFSGSYTDYVNPTNNAPLWSITAPATTDTIKAVWQIFSCAFSVGLLPPPTTIGTPTNPLTKAWLQSQVANYFGSNTNLCTGPWFNFYSQVLHQGLVETPYLYYYTAPYDDFLGIDGTITVDDTQVSNSAANVNITLGDMTNSTIPNILSDSTIYNVSFSLYPPGVTTVTFNGATVPTSGGPMGTASGSSMTMTIQYNTGTYSTSPPTTFTTQISPTTGTLSPILPGGANIVLSGNNLTVYIGAAPP